MNYLKHFIQFPLESSRNCLKKIGITFNLINTISFELKFFSATLFTIAAFLERETTMDLIGMGGVVILISDFFVIIYKRIMQKENINTVLSKLYTLVLRCYSELVILFGIFLCLIFHGYFIASIISFMALIGSIINSLVKVMTKGLGINSKKGLIKRSTRDFIISIGAIMCCWFKELINFDSMILLITSMVIIAILSNIGIVIHLYYCRKINQKIGPN